MDKFAYYDELLNHIKRSSVPTGLRTAALEHLVLGLPQSQSAKKHGVDRSNLNRLLKRIRELDEWVQHVATLRNHSNGNN